MQCIQLSDIKFENLEADADLVVSFYLSPITSFCFDHFSGDIVGRVTPVPIPNTEVKPAGADDTAVFNCGKVGSRRI